jgi:hypothetical protein
MDTVPKLLNSWKEIALHLGRGIRTAQRWEKDLGMPVHRPRGKNRSAVLAFSEELNRWLEESPVRSRDSVGTAVLMEGGELLNRSRALRSVLAGIHANAQQTRILAAQARGRASSLYSQLKQPVSRTGIRIKTR